MLKLIQKSLKNLISYMKKNAKAILILSLIIGVILYFYRFRENFRFKMPDLELEKDCRDYGYVCCRSSYIKEPMLIQKCRGGSMESGYMFYKCMRGDKIITSGLYDDYLIHPAGSLLRFSDNELYKLVSLDPTVKPPNCRIDNTSPYEETQSNIPVNY